MWPWCQEWVDDHEEVRRILEMQSIYGFYALIWIWQSRGEFDLPPSLNTLFKNAFLENSFNCSDFNLKTWVLGYPLKSDFKNFIWLQKMILQISNSLTNWFYKSQIIIEEKRRIRDFSLTKLIQTHLKILILACQLSTSTICKIY